MRVNETENGNMRNAQKEFIENHEATGVEKKKMRQLFGLTGRAESSGIDCRTFSTVGLCRVHGDGDS